MDRRVVKGWRSELREAQEQEYDRWQSADDVTVWLTLSKRVVSRSVEDREASARMKELKARQREAERRTGEGTAEAIRQRERRAKLSPEARRREDVQASVASLKLYHRKMADPVLGPALREARAEYQARYRARKRDDLNQAQRERRAERRAAGVDQVCSKRSEAQRARRERERRERGGVA